MLCMRSLAQQLSAPATSISGSLAAQLACMRKRRMFRSVTCKQSGRAMEVVF